MVNAVNTPNDRKRLIGWPCLLPRYSEPESVTRRVFSHVEVLSRFRLCFVARRDVHFYGNYVVVFVARNNLKIQSGLPYFRPTAIFLRLKVDDVDTGSGFVQTGDPDDK